MVKDYKEGTDFEMRKVKGKDGKTLYTNRHFFTKAEKAAKAAPAAKAPAKAPPKAAPKARPKPQPKAPVTPKVTTSAIPSDIGKAARKAIAEAPKAKKVAANPPPRPVSPTRDKNATGRYSKFEQARAGNYTEAQWDKMTKTQREAKGLPVSWSDWVRVGGKQAMKK